LFKADQMEDARDDKKGNVHMIVHHNSIDMSTIMHHVESDDEDSLVQFMIANVFGRLYFISATNTYVLCLMGEHQRAEEGMITFFKVEDLAAQVKACKKYVPACLDTDNIHWIRWIVTQPIYNEYMRRRMGPGRRLVGLSLSGQTNPPVDSAYLILAARPLKTPMFRHLANDKDYENYTKRIVSLKIPGTEIPAIPWFLSFMYWVRFDGDISSFISFLTLLVTLCHPRHWAPRKLFVFSGPQGCGKSETINFLLGFVNANNYAEIPVEMLAGKSNWTAQMMKPILVCHEAGSKWLRTLNNPFTRSIVTEDGSRSYEKKYGDIVKISGAQTVIIAADRSGDGRSIERDERRLLNIDCAKLPSDMNDYGPHSQSVRLFPRLFTQSNERLVDFREEFRQVLVDYIGIYFDAYSPSGLKTPKIFDRRDAFDEALDEDSQGSSLKASAPSAKRAKTAFSAITTNLTDAVHALVYHLAVNGTVFPVDDPAIFANLFLHNINIFAEKDTAQSKHNIHMVAMKASWQADRSSYMHITEDGKEEIFNDTMAQIYAQFKAEDESTELSQTRESRAYRRSRCWDRMLSKFKSLLMIKAWFDPSEDHQLGFWPRTLYINPALWLLGVWVNFLTHGNQLSENASNWGDISDSDRLQPVARLLLQRMTGRDNFSSGKHVSIQSKSIAFLGINLSSFLGIGRNTLELRPVALTWGAFSIIRNLIVHGGSNFKLTEEQIQSIVQRYGGEDKLNEKNREDYESIISTTKRHMMKKLYEVLSKPEGVLSIDEESRIFYYLYGDTFDRGPTGILTKDQFYATLPTIDVHVQGAPVSVNFRRSYALRQSPEDLGESVKQLVEVYANRTKTTRQESQEQEERKSSALFRHIHEPFPPSPLMEITDEVIDAGSPYQFVPNEADVSEEVNNEILADDLQHINAYELTGEELATQSLEPLRESSVSASDSQ